MSTYDKNRESIISLLAELADKSLTENVKRLNRRERGAYCITVKKIPEYNEVQIKLFNGRTETATAFIDYGHTRESRRDAIGEIHGTVKAYLCR